MLENLEMQHILEVTWKVSGRVLRGLVVRRKKLFPEVRMVNLQHNYITARLNFEKKGAFVLTVNKICTTPLQTRYNFVEQSISDCCVISKANMVYRQCSVGGGRGKYRSPCVWILMTARDKQSRNINYLHNFLVNI